MYKERIKVIIRQADPCNKTGDATKGGRGCKRISSDKASNLPKRDVRFILLK